MTTPTVTETRRHGGPVGERVELARYTVPAGENILYGAARGRRLGHRRPCGWPGPRVPRRT